MNESAAIPNPEGRAGVDVKHGGYSAGVHLFPFRTEKLSPATPMVLG